MVARIELVDPVAHEIAEGEEIALAPVMPHRSFKERVLILDDLFNPGVGRNQRIESRIKLFNHDLRAGGSAYGYCGDDDESCKLSHHSLPELH